MDSNTDVLHKHNNRQFENKRHKIRNVTIKSLQESNSRFHHRKNLHIVTYWWCHVLSFAALPLWRVRARALVDCVTEAGRCWFSDPGVCGAATGSWDLSDGRLEDVRQKTFQNNSDKHKDKKWWRLRIILDGSTWLQDHDQQADLVVGGGVARCHVTKVYRALMQMPRTADLSFTLTATSIVGQPLVHQAVHVNTSAKPLRVSVRVQTAVWTRTYRNGSTDPAGWNLKNHVDGSTMCSLLFS